MRCTYMSPSLMENKRHSLSGLFMRVNGVNMYRESWNKSDLGWINRMELSDSSDISDFNESDLLKCNSANEIVKDPITKEKDYLSEYETRFNVKFKELRVLIRPLTEEEINMAYPSVDEDSDIKNDIMIKTEEILCKTEEAVSASEEDIRQGLFRRDGSWRRMRVQKRNDLFERYKRKRQNFLNRNNRLSVSDMSDDDLAAKKKLKRGKKYELDYEWSPFSERSSSTPSSRNRRLRNQARRPIIESDTSSNEEDMLFNFYMDNNEDLEESKPALQDSVPSEFDHSDSNSSSMKETSRQSVSRKSSFETSDTNENKISSQNFTSGDILSDIIEGMNRTKNSNKIKSFKNSGQLYNSDNNALKIKKKSKSTHKENVKKQVSSILVDVVDAVSTKIIENDDAVPSNIIEKENALFTKIVEKDNDVSTKIADKDHKRNLHTTCKWCRTQFISNSATETFCNICKDRGVCEQLKNLPVNKKARKSFKITKPSKFSKTMSQVLKKLPKTEKRRLMYSDKSDKTIDKGFKDLNTSNIYKDSMNYNKQSISDTSSKTIIPKMKNLKRKHESSVTNQKKHKLSTEQKLNKTVCNNEKNKSIKLSNECKRKKINKEALQNKINTENKQKIGNKVKKNETKEIQQVITHKENKLKENSEEIRQKEAVDKNKQKSSYSLKECKDGLFLMTFPDELDIPVKTSPSETIEQKKISANNSKNISLSGVNDENDASSNIKRHQPNNYKPCNTYLFPPLPTVIVSNYSSDASNLNLSHTYYQNEITHQRAKAEKIINKMQSSKVRAIAPNNRLQVKPVLQATNSVKNSSIVIRTCSQDTNLQPFTTTVSFMQVPKSVGFNVVCIPQVNNVPVNATIRNIPSNINLFSSNNFSNLQVTISKSPVKMKESSVENKEIEITESHSVASQGKESELKESNKLHFPESYREISANKSPIVSMLQNKPNLESDNNDNDDMQQTPSDNSTSNKIEENANSLDLLKNASATDLIDAISILAIIDLEKNPLQGLITRIQVAKCTLEKYTNEKNITPELNNKIAENEYKLHLYYIAKKFLSIYGTFTRLSDHFLRKFKITQMIQIKKEAFQEHENSSQSSCMFSQPSQLNESLSNNDLDSARSASISNIMNKDRSVNNQNHIQKLQSQIAAMNNAQLAHYGMAPNSGTVHHYPVEQMTSLPLSAAPITPRNDGLVGESRETPSRGSGPRTPARPESAASHIDDLIQVKKEQFEAATSSPSSQCAVPQNTLPQISSQVPVIQESFTMPQHSVSNTPINLPVSNAPINLPVSNAPINLPVSNINQPNYNLHPAPHRTIAYDNSISNNQNYSDILLNIANKHPVSVTSVAPSPQINQNRQVLFGQQMFIQNTPGLCTKQAVPSINNNQYLISPPFSTANTGGTVIVNNPQVGQNALLTNVSNQQFYTSNQVPQLYYPPAPQPQQITSMPGNHISTIAAETVTATATNPTFIQPTDPEQLVCAVCNSQATLRCKQCAKVAYCNAVCARTYWHQRHKMECKPTVPYS